MSNYNLRAKRREQKAMLTTATVAIVAGTVIAFLLLLLTGGTKMPRKADHRELNAGLAVSLSEQAKDGPVYYADPFGGDGFYLALENDKLVALAISVPGDTKCKVSYRDSETSFIDCHGKKIKTTQLARYKTSVNATGADGSLIVNLGKLEPAPEKL